MDQLKLYFIVLFIFPTYSLHFMLQSSGKNFEMFELLILFHHIVPRQRCELWVWLACSDLSVFQGLPGPSGEKGPQGPKVRETFNWRVCSLNKKVIKNVMFITFCIALTVGHEGRRWKFRALETALNSCGNLLFLHGMTGIALWLPYGILAMAPSLKNIQRCYIMSKLSVSWSTSDLKIQLLFSLTGSAWRWWTQRDSGPTSKFWVERLEKATIQYQYNMISSQQIHPFNWGRIYFTHEIIKTHCS